jgi:hypothetical protein
MEVEAVDETSVEEEEEKVEGCISCTTFPLGESLRELMGRK